MTDLFFAELLYHPDSKFGSFFSAIGECPALIPVVYAVACIAIYLIKRKNLSKDTIKKCLIFFLYTVLALVATALVVSLLKKCWGRVRYVDLGANSDGFTPWYMPQGLTGNASFPSGHAAIASLIFFIPDCVKYFSGKRYKLLDLLCAAFAACVILARMLLGAHYLSDLIAGALIAYAMRKTAAITLRLAS